MSLKIALLKEAMNVSFTLSCTACIRCYNFCSTYDIYHEGKYADPNVYKRYKGPHFSRRL